MGKLRKAKRGKLEDDEEPGKWEQDRYDVSNTLGATGVNYASALPGGMSYSGSSLTDAATPFTLTTGTTAKG